MMSDIKKEEVDKFLEELSALSNKYGLSIVACGCCESPWICNDDCGIVGKYVCDKIGSIQNFCNLTFVEVSDTPNHE